jgi:hypothetical protein
MTARCEKCNAELRVSDWPWCPHGRSAIAAHPDDVPGGFVVENGFSTPQKFYSKKAHIEALEANGNMLAPRWVENDRHLTKWDAAIDPKTLENVTVLLSRKQKAYKDDVPSAPPKLIEALKDQFYR